MAERIRVAIIGGGIAGCTLANGLARYPNIEFDIFEGKSTFHERGASVGLAPNAQSALREMGMDTEKLFKDAGAGDRKATHALVAIGANKGKTLFQVPEGIYSVARIRWQEQLLKGLPKERLHANKKMTAIMESHDEDAAYSIRFEDGSVHMADMIVGCDGLHSQVRAYIVGSNDLEGLTPRFGGYWDARGRLTAERALEKFGTALYDPRSPAEVILVGDGSFILLIRSGEGDVCHFAVSAVAGPDYDQTAWKVPLNQDLLEKTYQGWDENIRSGIIEGLLAEDSGPGVVFSQWESGKTPTYYRGGVCMMGDSAHATTPWLGQGAAMATEDASVLSALLGSAQSRGDITLALQAFDHVRRGRPEHVIQQSREAAKVMTGQCGLQPLEIASLEAHKWWTDLWGIDMEAHIREAKEYFAGLKAPQEA